MLEGCKLAKLMTNQNTQLYIKLLLDNDVQTSTVLFLRSV
jgi:hypothetical protein